MISFVKHASINKQKWDNCISSSFNGLIYAYSWYLDIVAPGWNALIEDDYRSIMPLPYKSKLSVKYIAQPNFIQQLGVFSPHQLSDDIVNAFVHAIPAEYKLIQYNLNKYNNYTEERFSAEQWVTYEMDLIEPYKHLYVNYAENTRRNLRKATNVTLQSNGRPDQIIELFRQHKGKEIAHWDDEAYAILKKLIYTCIFKEKASVWSAYSQTGELCAGAFFLISNKKIIFLFSATNQYAKEHGVMPFLIDEFIKAHAEKELTLDFEGSRDANLARFYKGFGAKPFYYQHVELNNLSWSVKKSYQLVKNLRYILNKKNI